MKKSLFFKSLLSLVAVMGLSMFQSCSESGGTDDSGKEDEKLATLAVSTESLSFDADGNATDDAAGKVTITTDGSWTLSVDASNALTTWGWKFDNKSGSGNGSFTLTVGATEEAREAIITVSSCKVLGGEAVTKTIAVKQAGQVAATDKTVTAAELVAEMKDSSFATDFGSKYNYVLDVVVSKVIDGVAYVQDATAGIALNGEGLAANYASGDKLKITVPAREGKGNLVKGAGQLEFSTLTVVKGDNEAVAPVVATAADVVANKYVNMFVKIEKVATTATGVWTTGTADGEHTFTAAGTEFKAIVPKSAEEMVGAGYAVVAEGSMAGIAGTAAAKGTLIIVNTADVIDFEFSAPEAQSIDPAVYKFPVEGGSKEFTVTGVNLKGQTITVETLSSQYSYTVDNTVDNPVITITAKENTTGADLAEEAVKVVVAEGNSIDLTISQDDGYMSIPEVIELINKVGPKAEALYTDNYGGGFKFKGIVTTTVNKGAYNMNKGQFGLVTENCTEPGNGVIFSLGSTYLDLLYSYDFTLGDEVEIEVVPSKVGEKFTTSSGKEMDSGLRMNNSSFPLLVSFDGNCTTVKKTGRTVEVPVPTIDPADFYKYEAMLVTMELTTPAAGTMNAATYTNWIFSVGTPNIGFKAANTAGCPFLSKSYIATTAEATGIVQSYARESAYFQPQTLEHFKNFLAE